MAVNPSTACSCNLEEGSTANRHITTQTAIDNGSKTAMYIHIVQPIIVELIGTIFLILIGLLGTCSNDDNRDNSLISGLSFGLTLMVFIASLGHISGGYFNPAVTFGVFVAGNIGVKKALLYILMQTIGGTVAAGIFRLLSEKSIYLRCHGGATVLAVLQQFSKESNEAAIIRRINWWQGICIELVLTFVFVTVILMVSFNNKSKTNLAPVYIGVTLCVCTFASNMLTGASLNPARSLGPAIFVNMWSYHYVYWIGPVTGAAIAGASYRFVWNTNCRNALEKK